MVTRRPAAPPVGTGPALFLARAVHRPFQATARLLDDPALRDETARYFDDLARPYGYAARPGVLGDEHAPSPGQAYGEMAAALIGSLVDPAEPVDLLVLAFSVHDMLPGRATATYLSHVCPGTPRSFAICDQGTAAAFSGLRIVASYAAAGLCHRALLIVVEQAVLPYDTPARRPADHHGVAMLYEAGARASALARVGALRQRAGVDPDAAGALAAAGVAELAGGGEVYTVLSGQIAETWAGHEARVSVAPPGQPGTGVWSTVVDDLTGRPGERVIAADYDPDLRYLSLAELAPARVSPAG